jgi:formylglycine-generating enzyme required for sulfatase activity
LSARTGVAYRLPTGAEWARAARAGAPGVYAWGNNPFEACRFANYNDHLSAYAADPSGANCNDGHIRTSPAGAYPANRLGLFDMTGDVSQWTLDCVRVTPAPTCTISARGGSWADPIAALAIDAPPRLMDGRDNRTGFRLAHSLRAWR